MTYSNVAEQRCGRHFARHDGWASLRLDGVLVGDIRRCDPYSWQARLLDGTIMPRLYWRRLEAAEDLHARTAR
jgi:hypothetical protein